MAKLGSAATANTPVVENLNAASGQLHTLFTNLASCSQPHTGNQCGFANASLPALQVARSGVGHRQAGGPDRGADGLDPQQVRRADEPGRRRHRRARPEPGDRAPGPRHPEPRGRARSAQPRRQGLQRPARRCSSTCSTRRSAINTFGPFGHMLAVDAFANPMCSPYATPGTIAANLKTYGAAYRQCYSWLGPEPAGRQRDRPVEPERMRARSRWRAAGRDRTRRRPRPSARPRRSAPTRRTPRARRSRAAPAPPARAPTSSPRVAYRASRRPGTPNVPGRARGGQQGDRRRHRVARRSHASRRRACRCHPSRRPARAPRTTARRRPSRPSSSSTTSCRHEAQAAIRVCQPRADRRGHRARAARRRVPGLQRERGAAVRAHARAQGRHRERVRARGRQRRARGRLPDRDGVVAEAGDAWRTGRPARSSR